MSELTYERVLELFAESDRRVQEQRLEWEKERNEREKSALLTKQESEKGFEELRRVLAKSNADTNKKIAELGDTLGRFAEEQVRADIMNKFQQWNIPVHAITNHYVQKDQKNEFVYEVDILIYNSQYAIALEVKNTLKTDHVDQHLERMKKIQNFPMMGLQGKTLLAGVAGMIVGEGVDKYAESKGLFVLKPSGDSVRIVNNKNTFKPREWAVA